MKCLLPNCDREAVYSYRDCSAPGGAMRLCEKHDSDLERATAQFNAAGSLLQDTTDVLRRIETKVDDLIRLLKEPP